MNPFEKEWTIIHLAIPTFATMIALVVVDITAYKKRQSIVTQSASRNDQMTLYDLPGLDFPIKASLSVVLLNFIFIVCDVLLRVEPRILNAQFFFNASVAITIIKMITMPIVIYLSSDYNRKCNSSDRQYCNLKAWDYYGQISSTEHNDPANRPEILETEL